MGLLAVQTAGSQVGWDDGSLVLRYKGKVERVIKPHLVSEVHLYGRIELSAAAREHLLTEGKETLFFSSRGDYMGRLVGAESSYAARRMAQYKYLSDPACVLRMAREIVATKLERQRGLVARWKVDHAVQAGLMGRVLEQMTEAEGGARAARSLDTLRGWEGFGARLFFEALGGALKGEVRFEGRNRRPPRDPVNACLSFGYTLLAARCERALQEVGLDPHLGALHEAGRGKAALALDLSEGWRWEVDRTVVRLFNLGQLKAGHFVGDAQEGVYLGEDGRRVFLEQWSALWGGRVSWGGRQEERGRALGLEGRRWAREMGVEVEEAVGAV